MARKIVFVEVPYVGITMAEGNGLTFGFKELLKPDCDFEFYCSEEGKEELEKFLSGREGGLKKDLVATAGIGGATVGIVIALGATPIGAAAWFGTLGWKAAGKKRAFKKALKGAKDGEVYDVNLEGLYQIASEEGLEDSISEYYALHEARKESLGRGVRGFFRRNLSKFEDDEMADYRRRFIHPAFRRMEERARKEWKETGNAAFYHIQRTYDALNDSLGKKERLGSSDL